MTPRITIVGGGSTHWTPRILCDFANTRSLAGAHVTLHDIDASALDQMVTLGEHVKKVRDLSMEVRGTTNLAAAVDGADFVVTALSVGGFGSMRHDLEIPERYGIRQPVGDSVGPGGISRALRSIPVMVGIAREVEARSPDAWLINVSNPLSALCRAVTKETAVRTVGLCNELVGMQFQMSLLFDADMRSVDPTVGGVNHLPLITGLQIGGRDGFAMLRDLLADPGEVGGEPIWMNPPPASAHWRKVSPGETWTKADVIANNRIRFELLNRFGVMTGATDTHTSEFFAGFVTEKSDWGRAWGVHHYGMSGHQADKEEDVAYAASLLDTDDLAALPSGELVAPLLDGLVGGPARALPVNLPNRGQVTNLDADVVVECMGIAERGGVRARDVVTVPGVMGEFLHRVAVSQELTVEASCAGDGMCALAAMFADPMTGRLPYEDVVSLTEELLGATSSWLPQFPDR